MGFVNSDDIFGVNKPSVKPKAVEPINYDDSILKEQADDITEKLISRIDALEASVDRASEDSKLSKITSVLSVVISFLAMVISALALMLQAGIIAL